MNLRLVYLTCALAGISWTALAQSVPARPTPPPVPVVRPIVSAPVGVDKNGNRVDDAIDDRVTSAQTLLRQRSASPQELKIAQAVLDEPVAVEFVFSDQITQEQIDAFLAAGGKFDKIFEAVSFGWTGTIPQSKAADISTSMGKTLLGIIEAQPIELHMDEATRTGRVRPQVWDLGVKGDGDGVDRVTVAILDTGVDGTHTDLAGRMEYWADWTSDGHVTAQDAGGHGSHVAGIAVGAGAAYMTDPDRLSYTDTGYVPDGGNFFLSPIHIPLSSSSWLSTLYWQQGTGVTQLSFGQVYRNDSGGASSFAGHAGPVTVTTNPYPLGSNLSTPQEEYMGYVANRGTQTGNPYYAISHYLDYPAPTDGYSQMSGVAPESHWAGFKVFTDNGGGNSNDLANALDDLVVKRDTYKIKVANMSLGITLQPGDPGYPGPGENQTMRNKTNTAALNGIVVVCSAGNSGNSAASESGDPGRAQYAITVASSSDINQLTEYSSHGFGLGGQPSAGDEDMKPDICAPGGSVAHQSNILSVDSNTNDGGYGADVALNNYANLQGTSMASPFLAGCAALVIDAMQRNGESWDFTGAGALEDVLRVKSLLLMTATETNTDRETGIDGFPSASGNPVLQRGGKDINEGYGIVNADAAVEAFMNPALNAGVAEAGSFVTSNDGRRCWARRVVLTAGSAVNLDLDVPPAGDYDLYLYAEAPDAYGNPVILDSSVTAANDTNESLDYVPVASQTGYLVVKKVSGNGGWTLGGTAPVSMSAFSLE